MLIRVVYRAGFAAQHSEYHLTYEDGEDDISEIHFAPSSKETAGAKMKQWLTDMKSVTILDKEHVVYPEPEETAIETTRTQLYSIEKECKERYGIKEFSQITTVLSGPGNYRERLATVFPYKGNRDSAHKPHWYQSIRNYLTGEWGAVVVSGREADDECSILARRDWVGGREFVVATIDKDLDQIPGNHYNYLKQVFYAQSEYDAELFFWQQSLSGDATDGIPGCTGIGEVRAGAILAALLRGRSQRKAQPRLGLSTVSAVWRDGGRECWDNIVECYRKAQEKRDCPFLGRNPEEVALETARLVFLQHYEGQLWNPPGIPHGTLPEYTDDE